MINVHALLERRSLRHGLKNTKSLVGEHKLKQAKALLDLFNAKNMRPKWIISVLLCVYQWNQIAMIMYVNHKPMNLWNLIYFNLLLCFQMFEISFVSKWIYNRPSLYYLVSSRNSYVNLSSRRSQCRSEIPHFSGMKHEKKLEFCKFVNLSFAAALTLRWY